MCRFRGRHTFKLRVANLRAGMTSGCETGRRVGPAVSGNNFRGNDKSVSIVWRQRSKQFTHVFLLMHYRCLYSLRDIYHLLSEYELTSGYRSSPFSSNQSIHFSRYPPFPPFRIVSPSATTPRNILARVIATLVSIADHSIYHLIDVFHPESRLCQIHLNVPTTR